MLGDAHVLTLGEDEVDLGALPGALAERGLRPRALRGRTAPGPGPARRGRRRRAVRDDGAAPDRRCRAADRPRGRHRRPARAARPPRGGRHPARALAGRETAQRRTTTPRADERVHGVLQDPPRVRVLAVPTHCDQPRASLERPRAARGRATRSAPSWSSRKLVPDDEDDDGVPDLDGVVPGDPGELSAGAVARVGSPPGGGGTAHPGPAPSAISASEVLHVVGDLGVAQQPRPPTGLQDPGQLQQGRVERGDEGDLREDELERLGRPGAAPTRSVVVVGVAVEEHEPAQGGCGRGHQESELVRARAATCGAAGRRR